MRTLAIDIGGTKLAAALVDDTLNIFARREIPTPGSRTSEALEGALSNLVAPLKGHADCFAAASTGIIRHGVLTALNPANLGGLEKFPLFRVLNRLTGLPGITLNDAQAAAWAEYNALGSNIRDMVFITVSTGVGGGIVSNGELLTGPEGLAGHLGHMIADPCGPLCGCGRKGCVEAIASGRGIAAAAQYELEGLTAKSIFAHAATGNIQANTLIQRSAECIATLIADLRIITDCQKIVLGGSIGLAPGYINRVCDVLNKEPDIYNVSVSPASYRNNAGIIGAALLAEKMIKKASPYK
ncbi:N-acetylmannosamine kinase [Escherichia coli]|uniref:N-acetylmannosamine kinase n=1 Tax=Escherichia coli TaxID=562 RepID=UPI000D126425|nr:N-acetylmannosamine kinase [Escherichia coli]EEX1985489.1 N-acetylmannosamine kinase [Escherichia coli]EEX2584799.1 N-acetylmannosamine kinase [Escherichia coli]EEX3419984.1 N-acetylmannosamine kinase [Escherichia coli]EFA5732650.1 N-acetylmannosamine kinase [Escherichia coli]EFB6516074.1 N-acetylmannosamine kinase [Escherichia coli]